MNYQVKFIMSRRDSINPLPPHEAPQGLLVGESSVLEYLGEGSAYGSNRIRLFPAFKAGEGRVWMFQKIWRPAPGYCASGTSESILSFEDGLERVAPAALAAIQGSAFLQKNIMQDRGSVNPLPDRTVAEALSADWRLAQELHAITLGGIPNLFMVQEASASWAEGHSQYGHDEVQIFPAQLNGKQCWVKRCVWQPDGGYGAEGTKEVIIPFNDGLSQAIQREQFFWA